MTRIPVKIIHSETGKCLGFQKSLGLEYASINDTVAYFYLYEILSRMGNNSIKYESRICIQSVDTGEVLYETKQGYVSNEKMDGGEEKFWKIIPLKKDKRKFLQQGDEVYIINAKWSDNYMNKDKNNWVKCYKMETVWRIEIDDWTL